MTFGERLEKLLISRNIQKKELAISLGIRIPTVSDWKRNGTVPAGDLCIKIADTLGVSVEWLITGKETEGVPHDILDMAYEIMALPEPLRQVVIGTLEVCKKQCIKPEEAGISGA